MRNDGNKSNNLPTGWTWTTVGEISESIQYGYTASATSECCGAKFLRITDIQENFVNWESVPYCQIADSDKKKFLLHEGDLVFARTGATVGKSYLIRGNIPESVFASYLIRICLDQNLSKSFIANFFHSHLYWSQIHKGKAGIGQPNVNATKLSQITLPLPPLPEQHRIVGKIEELFTKLDAGAEELKKAKAQLRRYRRSVLEAAVTGRLTQQWRMAHKGEVEPAKELFGRILNERYGKTEQEEQTERHEITNDLSVLPQIPPEWIWTRLDRIAEIKGGVTKNTQAIIDDPVSLPYLRVANVQRGYLDLSEIKHIEIPRSRMDDLLLKNGDILFTEGGDRDKLGRGWVWQSEIPICTHQNHIFRARLSSSDLSSEFISWFGNTFGQRYFLREGTQTTNLASINMTKLSAFPVPLPPVAEQKVIIEEVERNLSIVDKLEAVVDEQIIRSMGLRQSILFAAFRGRLVPQNPSDELAEKLLGRIRADNDARISNKRRNIQYTTNRETII